MIEAGLVERQPCPTDRRVSSITLTPAGRDTIGHATVAASGELRAAFSGVTTEEPRAPDDILDRLRNERHR
ncbi:MarR family winged helix-turn-helix transcriptional regulator [Streptomyces sp. NPDC059853]|uniref:MarR family winged helix-turn-helix transcriptional regulator n=1 Tax=Streptomyces sp. NPDC059853 TaxID=3346973 RepID=UPI00365F33D2